MKQKIISLLLFATLLLSLTLVSATVTLDSNSITLSKDATTAQVMVTNTGTSSLTVSAISETIAGVQVTSNSVTILPTQTQTITYTASSDINNLEISDSKTFNIDDKELTINMQGDYCDYTNPNNNLKLKIDNIDTKEGFGDDEDYWYPLDEVEIELEIENDGDDDIDNIEIEWILYDEDNNEIMDGDESDFDLKDGDSETVTLTLKIDPDDLNEDMSDFVFIVKASGEDTDHNDEDICASDSETIEARIENFVIVDEIELTGGSCGTKSYLNFDVWNVGDSDLDDDEVYVNIYSKSLGLDEVIEFEKGIDSLEKESVSFEFTVTEDVTEGLYGIDIVVYEDEDMSDNDIFENKEDDKSEFKEVFRISGDCQGSGDQDVEIAAALSENTPTPRAGKTLIILATLENTGQEDTEYTVSVSGVSSWASADISPKTFTINAGDTKVVEISLDIDNDAEIGEKQFTIKADYDTGSQSQDVAIEVEKGFALGNHFRDNWFIYTVILIDVILIIAIIVAIARIVSKKSA